MVNNFLQAIIHAIQAFRVGSGTFQIALAGAGEVHDGGQGLVHLVGDAGGKLPESGKPGGMGQFVGQAAVALLGFHPGGDIPGYADDFNYGAGIGFPDGPTGNFEPPSGAVPMNDLKCHGGVAVIPEQVSGLRQFLGNMISSKDVFERFAP